MEEYSIKYHLKDIDSVAKHIIKRFKHKVILFNGEMGAGKTTLIKALTKTMNSLDKATSPTFSIVNEYRLPNDKIYHFDFYRIDDIEDVYNFGIEEYLYSNHWIFIEWPEKISTLLPNDLCILHIGSNNQNQRTLKLAVNTNHITENNAYEELK